MQKIYGYKDEDLKNFTEYLKNKPRPLTRCFKEYALLSGKADGTIRNMYYAIAKKSRTDKDFNEEFLHGETFKVNKPEKFGEQEKLSLIKKILEMKASGKSVRAAISVLSGGDEKLSLRYQNKFRNVVKTEPGLIDRLLKEIEKGRGGKLLEFSYTKMVKNVVPDQMMKKLQSAVNGLVEKISSETKKENAMLKEKLRILEKENLKLKGQETPSAATRFFRNKDKNAVM